MTEKSTKQTAGDRKTVCCIGAGSIGASWAAHFLRAGLRVISYDSSPEREAYLRDAVKFAWPTLERLGLSSEASIDNLSFTTNLAEALNQADFVQESVFEDLAMKQKLLAEVDAILPAEVVIASSSSGFLASDLRAACTKHPERVIVGHPFNPVYLVPLVEIAAGDAGSPEAVENAQTFYEKAGQKVVVLQREINGYIANRLQYAVWREILYMFSQGTATLEDIDDAMTYGPASRWAALGPSAVFYLGGRTKELYDSFVVDDLWRELLAGYAAPGDFIPDRALIDRYIEQMHARMKDKEFADMRRDRDRDVTSVRVALGQSQL
ncbi:L-carnitine dehydrogenase [Mesorhizobium amorphae]|uniref:3-hydroxyacyl-CoA dehydrogenase NAD-binding domain-containing protein n=1 Tax=Mesorhizobium amorphae TaxID=71433 RepID=UPI00235BF72F|nr:3-hydroxyacyl-CoA dehydrogenase NAD-binding domain-containing protein [Mesorhizobium amorphae]GLR45265.1 L-carnitine dehydrogenase [Mesorhizobium amorphae]